MSSLLGHALAGWTVSSAVDTRGRDLSAKLWAGWLVLLAVFPDVDYLIPALRSGHHAGLRITHSGAFACLLPLLTCCWLLLAGSRGADLRTKSAQAVLAGVSHLLLDLLVGVTPAPLLWPLSATAFRLPFGVLPSAGQPRLSNPLFYRNLFIELGALLPLASIPHVLRSGRLPFSIKGWMVGGLAAGSLLFMAWAFSLER